MVFVPDCDGFDEVSGGKAAAPDGTRSGAADGSSNGIGDTRMKDPFCGRWKRRERNDVVPDDMHWCVHHDGCDYGTDRRLESFCMLNEHEQRKDCDAGGNSGRCERNAAGVQAIVSDQTSSYGEGQR